MALANSSAARFTRCCCCSSIKPALLSCVLCRSSDTYNSAYERACDVRLRGLRHSPLGPFLARRRVLPRDRPNLGLLPLLGPLFARRRVFPSAGGRSSGASDPAVEVPKELSALL